MVEQLLPYKLPIFIIDDGSDEHTQAELITVAGNHPQVRLLRLDRNCGKGAAVMHGMRAAAESGFSHGLQIDADGQHDTADVPRFIACSKASPDVIVCGKPVYDDSVPKGRLYGRYITHFWVWIETLSFAIGDSMCGFRMYPLSATCKLINSTRIQTRMDFDIDIIVRLYWAGLPVKNISTRVIYPKNGISHFHLWRDNLRISLTHSRLFFAMLPRLPGLLWRHRTKGPTPQHHWHRIAERGCGLGLSLVATCHRLLGARLAGLLLYPVVAWFYVFSTTSRTASRDFLRRVAQHADKPPPSRLGIFRHMLAFAQSSLDKFAAWSGCFDGKNVVFPERAVLDALLASGRGALIIGSHLGNLEMMRALATAERLITINAVVYTEHAQRFTNLLASANADFGVNLVQVSNFGPDTAITFRDKIDRGELLVIVGDRTPPAENGRTSTVDFLGAPAPFAQGPFIMANLLECPVYLLFCLRENGGYQVHFEHFSERLELPRGERGKREQQLRKYIQAYARRLESYCLRAPEQWFNFYDFWHQNTANITDPDRPRPLNAK